MPANRGETPADWSPRSDFQRPTQVTHYRPRPQSIEHLSDLLDDMSIIPEAEAYRTLDDGLVREAIETAAEEIYPHVRADRPEYFTIEEVVRWRELKGQIGTTAFGVAIYPDGSRIVHSN